MPDRPPSKINSPGIGYRLLSLVLLFLWILHAGRLGRKHGLANYRAMRTRGFECSNDAAMIWVHASSVGEVAAVTPLVRACLKRGEKLLCTSFTATGYQAIQRIHAASVCSGVIPIDFSQPCRRFFQNHQIKLGLIMETELWPELLYQARKRNIPLVQINARLSKKSLGSRFFIRRWLATSLSYFSQFLTRSVSDRDALIALGADASKIAILGNLKSLGDSAPIPARLIERDYLVLASSHPNEEQQFIESAPDDLAGLLLVIAPRHPDRSSAIQKQLDQLGVRYSVRSRSQKIEADTQLYLADTLGELKALMAHARIVIMGGSFADIGGHNLIEAANLGCATITGPSDSNIAEDINMLGKGSGILQVENMAQCWQSIRELIDHPERAKALAEEAKFRLSQQPDVVTAYLNAIDHWL